MWCSTVFLRSARLRNIIANFWHNRLNSANVIVARLIYFSFKLIRMEIVVRSDIQPGVIDIKIIEETVKEQGPKGEAGKLIEEEGYSLKEIPYLRLEFLNILRIDHLWMMTGLTKLQLGNNIIEKIENLDSLVNLRDLDLSFNTIKVIENLEKLTKIKALTFFQNSIVKVHNLDTLKNLEIFSIGNNKIEDKSCVLYLRQFKQLKSLNMAGNPCSTHNDFRQYVAAFIPQLIYYEYKLLTTDEFQNSRTMYFKDLENLEKEEDKIKQIEEIAEEKRGMEAFHTEAFVEYLDGDQLTEHMMELDPNGRALLLLGEDYHDIFNSFQEQVRRVTTDIFNLGQNQLQLRKDEIQQFSQCMQQAKLQSQKKSQEIVENFTEKKSLLFARVQELIVKARENVMETEHTTFSIGAEVSEFNCLCQRTWKRVMGIELVLFEQLEELISQFEKNLREMANQLIEEAQVHFTLIREHENIFSEGMRDLATRSLTQLSARGDDLSSVPHQLQLIMKDKQGLLAQLMESHDIHLQVIESREDQLISNVRHWHRTLCDDLQTDEIARNRATVLELNHFLDIQKEEFHMFDLDLKDGENFLLDDASLLASTPRSGSLCYK